MGFGTIYQITLNTGEKAQAQTTRPTLSDTTKFYRSVFNCMLACSALNVRSGSISAFSVIFILSTTVSSTTLRVTYNKKKKLIVFPANGIKNPTPALYESKLALHINGAA